MLEKPKKQKKKTLEYYLFIGRYNLDAYKGGVKFSLYWAELKMDSAR